MGNHESVTGWQKLFFLYKCLQLSAAVAIATFENPQVTSVILICSLRLCLQNFSTVNCFRVYRKLSRDQVVKKACTRACYVT